MIFVSFKYNTNTNPPREGDGWYVLNHPMPKSADDILEIIKVIKNHDGDLASVIPVAFQEL